ncbi:Hsp33 family molecular chaperone HslO [Bacillus sp. SL00103]
MGGLKSNDYLVKALAYDGKVRAYLANTTDTINEAQRRHHTWPTASAAIGRNNDCHSHDGCYAER